MIEVIVLVGLCGGWLVCWCEWFELRYVVIEFCVILLSYVLLGLSIGIYDVLYWYIFDSMMCRLLFVVMLVGNGVMCLLYMLLLVCVVWCVM